MKSYDWSKQLPQEFIRAAFKKNELVDTRESNSVFKNIAELFYIFFLKIKLERMFGKATVECSINRVLMDGHEFFIFLVKKSQRFHLNIPLISKI